MKNRFENKGTIYKIAGAIIAVMMSLALILGAAGSYTVINSRAASVISKSKAKKLALKAFKVKAGKLVDYEIEYDSDSKKPKYEITFSTDTYDYEMEMYAKNGKIIEKSCEISEEPEYEAGKSIISAKKAKKKALADAGLKKAKKVKVSLEDYEEEDEDSEDEDIDESEEEQDYGYYEVTFKNAGYTYEYEIDPVKGIVLKSHMELIKK